MFKLRPSIGNPVLMLPAHGTTRVRKSVRGFGNLPKTRYSLVRTSRRQGCIGLASLWER